MENVISIKKSVIFIFKLTDLLNRVMSIFVGNRQRRLFNSVAGQIEISKKYFKNYFIIKARGFHYLLGFFYRIFLFSG